MGTSAAATTPANIKLSGEAAPTYTSANNYTLTSVASNGGSTSTSNISTGGTYNFLSVAGTSDRALGFLNSGTYGTPRSIMLAVSNSSGATIQDLTVQFNLEKYRSGSREYNWTFYTSPDGVTWTAQSAGAQNYPADASNTVFYAPPQTITKTVPLLGVNLANGATYYLRWSQVGVGGTISGSTNGQASGLDNLVLTPTLAGGPPPPPTGSISTGSVSPTSFCVTATAGSAVSVPFTSTGTYTSPYSVQLSDATGVFPASATAGLIGSGDTSPIAATIPAGTPSGTKYRVRVLNSNPATLGSNNGADLTVSLTPADNPVAVTPSTPQSVTTTGTGGTLTASAATGSAYSWLYSTNSVGPFTSTISGATVSTYQVKGADFPGAGTFYVVAQAVISSACGTATGLSTPVELTVTAPVVAPALTVSPTTLPDFGSVASGAGSTVRNFAVSGSSLTDNITITPPAGFEIRTGTNPFACCAIVLAPTGGSVPSTTIDVRFVPTAAQPYQASIPVTSNGLPSQSVAVSGTGVEAVYPATLSTTAVTNLTPTSASTGGTVALDGGTAVTARGVVWAKTANPILGTTKTADGAGSGTFTSAITGLLPGTTYFVRAYATNATSTAYGEEFTFTTVAVPLAAEPTQPAALTASQVTSTSLQLNLSGGDGAKRLVVAHLGSAVDADPQDATTYTADQDFGQGSVLGKGNYVVYNGTGSTVQVTNLRANTPYYFSVFAFNDNDTPYAENYLTTTPGTLQQQTVAAPAAMLLEENFEYPAGSLLTANNWTAHSGGGTNAVAVTTTGLAYPGYGANSGNAAALVTSGEDVNRTFEAVYGRTPVYVSALVKVSKVSTTGDYFFHLGPKVIGSNFRSRVFVKQGSSTSKVQFGISGSGAATYAAQEYDLNATYLLVIKYSFDEAGNVSQLFVNPTTDTEPTTASASSTETGTTPSAPNDNIGSVALRQGASSPALQIDGIRVGTTYRVVKTGLICLQPEPSFTAAPVCQGAPTAFTDASKTVEANATYAWDFDSNGTVDLTTAGNVSYTYPAAGTYTAKLTITQGACSDTYTQQITVRALPTAALTGNATICTGETASLTVHLTGSAPWLLAYSPDGGTTTTPLTITAADVTGAGNYLLAVSPTATTTYTLASLTDANCQATALTGSATITVNTPPVLTAPTIPTANTSATECGASVTFVSTATGAPAPVITYSVVKDGQAQAITSPYFFPVGTTIVTATATNSCGTVTKTFSVVVQDKQAPAVLVRNITVALSNGTATITPSQVDNGSTDACGIASTTLSKTTFDCGNIGANAVTLTVTDIHGNVASQTATVTVTGSIPNPQIAVVPASTVYTGGVATTLYLGYGPQSVTLTASDGASYQWSPTAGLSSASTANPVFTATAAGTYTYTVTATSPSGCTAIKSVTLTVIDARCGVKNDKVLLCHKGKAACVTSADVADYLKHGDTLGDCTTTATKTAVATSATDSSAASQGAMPTAVFEAYPNPFSERAVVHFRPEVTGTAKLQLYNTLGQMVKTLYDGPAQAGQDYEFTVEGAAFAAGLYTGRLLIDGKVQTVRLVLTK
ncbi:PKD domain-containing protein [Hymenobacter sp. BT770]|uniref:PKD domain-containing protein n=1 Tax=Hymenobacter sp. BT770 TaxID=2886942 RepID=UPI001D117910|nr:PKD domain-containing protein [Hymenobacter sp. BT770]MCC3155417.1 PKD domain-containing protein [Hymenobacter sp. BT770]MDO3417452.1 PKD domain-containing protein [Hymenobacter sp. BT770]